MTSFIEFPKFSELQPTTFPARLKSFLIQQSAAMEHVLQTHSGKIFTWSNLLLPLEEMHDRVEKFWSPFSHLHSVHNTPEIRSAYDQCLPLLTEHHTKLQQHEALYKALCSIDKRNLTSTQCTVLEDTLLDFELSGVALSTKEKTRFQEIENELSELATRFDNHLIDAELSFSLHITKQEQLKGLPGHFLQAAQLRAQEENKPGWILKIDAPSYTTAMTYADDRSLRQTLYHAYTTRASAMEADAHQFDNRPLMERILILRYELAQLLGYPNYAALSLKKKMASTSSEVRSFLEHILDRARPQGKQEFEHLQAFAQKHHHLLKIEPWDVAYLSDKKKQHQFTIDEEELRPYFTQTGVWKGIEFILEKLFNFTLKKVEGVDVWHPSVRCLEISDQHQIRGYLYVDLFARPYKKSGAWMDTLQTRWRITQEQVQLPIVTLTCNFTPPIEGNEATLLHDEVLTLLHELGHCLHHIVSQVDEYSLSGLHGIEWDAVELPSQLMEHWGWNQLSLQKLSQHQQTQTALPEKQIDALKKTQSFQSGLALLRQLEFALFDLTLHDGPPNPAADWIHTTLTTLREKISVIPISPENRFENSFSHIFSGGYAAGYYSYLWAEVLSSDVFSRFELNGVFDSNTGQELLHKILEAGHTYPAKTLFESFMGRKVSIQAFLRHRGIDLQ